jgi:hypothetical protein
MGGGFGCHVPSPAAVDASTSTAATGDSAPENPDPARPQQHPDSLATGSGGTIQGPGGKELTVQPKPDIDRTITLSFRTLGAPGAGKTRWLAETYLGLRSGLALEGSQIESMPTPASDEFRQLIEQMHEEKQRVAAAQHEGIPSPLIFHFRGRHHWRKSDILFDMSDYSGDMAERRQATDADGYLFFLDLTRPISELIDVLYDFREDVMGVCGLKPGRELRTPVALCFSKIDLLVNLPSACGAVEGFYHELAAIGWGLDLRSIERRSELARELRKVIWPDWEVERQIRALFGARFLYFPLTTVGLNELGITDLKRRTIEPCGLLHPMLWLLEMNGYHVFQRKSMFDWIGRLAPWRT